MAQPPYPPPPPVAQPQQPLPATRRNELHLPRTNIFKSFRAQMASLERVPRFKDEMEPILGLIGAFVISAFATLLVSLAVVNSYSQYLEQQQAGWIGTVVITPPIEEIMKALSTLVVALVLPRVFSNRRYGAAMGAAAGLGYSLSEDLTYFTNPQYQATAFIRLIIGPFMHPVFSAFSGMGVFVFISRRQMGKKFSESLFGLPLILLLIGIIYHSIWNASGFLSNAGGIWAAPYLALIVSAIVFIPPFLFILRDLLGGHFNFQHFFEILPEPSLFYPAIAPPPPPPQIIPTCPTCGQPLAFIQEYNRWYCPTERKYV